MGELPADLEATWVDALGGQSLELVPPAPLFAILTLLFDILSMLRGCVGMLGESLRDPTLTLETASTPEKQIEQQW